MTFLSAASALYISRLGFGVSLVGLVLVGLLWAGFDVASGRVQFVERASWIPSLNVEYFLGVDGISMPLVLLTTVLSFLAMLIVMGYSRRREFRAGQARQRRDDGRANGVDVQDVQIGSASLQFDPAKRMDQERAYADAIGPRRRIADV